MRRGFKSDKQRKKVMSILVRRLHKLGLTKSDKLPKTIAPSTHQYGKLHKKQDLRFRALKPGKRVSSTGKVYYEHRKNRSDVHPAQHL